MLRGKVCYFVLGQAGGKGYFIRRNPHVEQVASGFENFYSLTFFNPFFYPFFFTFFFALFYALFKSSLVGVDADGSLSGLCVNLSIRCAFTSRATRSSTLAENRLEK